MTISWKPLPLVVFLFIAAYLAGPPPAMAVDKCDLVTLVAMFKYGEMRVEISETTNTISSLGPAADSLTLVELLGCDLDRLRAGTDCVEDLFPGLEPTDLPARVLACGEDLGISRKRS